MPDGGGGARSPLSRRARLAAAATLALWASAAAAQRCGGLAATDMVFTGYTPFGPGASATSTLTYSCPPGVTQAWIAISRPRTLRSGANVMQFDVYQSSDLAAAWPDAPPAAVPATASGSVTAYGFLPPQDAAAGSYGDVLFVTLYSGPGQAFSGRATIRVRSSVAPACTIAAGTLSFGSYDPLVVNAVNPLDAQGTFQIACTRSTAYTVALGPGGFPAGAVRQMASGARRLQYDLYTDPGRTTPWTTASTLAGTAPSTAPVTLPVYGRVPGGQPASAGVYVDTVQSTINF